MVQSAQADWTPLPNNMLVPQAFSGHLHKPGSALRTSGITSINNQPPTQSWVL